MEAIQAILKQLAYNPDTKRVLPSSPYWSMGDAAKQASTMKPNSKEYYDALTEPIGSMAMAATTGPQAADPLAASLNSYLKQAVTSVKPKPNPNMQNYFSPQGKFEVVQLGNGKMIPLNTYQSAAQARKALDMMPMQDKAGYSFNIRDVTPQ